MSTKRFVEKMSVRFTREGRVDFMEVIYRLEVPVPEFDGDIVDKRISETFLRKDLSSSEINALENMRGGVMVPALNKRRPMRMINR